MLLVLPRDSKGWSMPPDQCVKGNFSHPAADYRPTAKIVVFVQMLRARKLQELFGADH